MLDSLLDAFIDSIKLLPLLLIVYIILELVESYGVKKYENSKLLNGTASPVFGSLFGCVPQCGLGVISTDLYSRGKLSIGALVAVYIATSDEAIPIMLANVKAIPSLLILILVKILFGILVGYLSMFLYKHIFKKQDKKEITVVSHITEKGQEHDHPNGCCSHEIEHKGFNIWHPIIHSLKIFGFILAFNVIFGLIIYFVGADKIYGFLQKQNYLQPLFSVIGGLIPNCVSSVVLTELYLAGGISFGSIVAGLCVNAGISLIVLFKNNKNIKENLFILFMLIIPSLILGYGLHFLV